MRASSQMSLQCNGAEGADEGGLDGWTLESSPSGRDECLPPRQLSGGVGAGLPPAGLVSPANGILKLKLCARRLCHACCSSSGICGLRMAPADSSGSLW